MFQTILLILAAITNHNLPQNQYVLSWEPPLWHAVDVLRDERAHRNLYLFIQLNYRDIFNLRLKLIWVQRLIYLLFIRKRINVFDQELERSSKRLLPWMNKVHLANLGGFFFVTRTDTDAFYWVGCCTSVLDNIQVLTHRRVEFSSMVSFKLWRVLVKLCVWGALRASQKNYAISMAFQNKSLPSNTSHTMTFCGKSALVWFGHKKKDMQHPLLGLNHFQSCMLRKGSNSPQVTSHQ